MIVKPIYWDEAKVYLINNDEILSRVINNYQGDSFERSVNPFLTLTRAIIGQQISVNAADAIWQRLNNLVGEFKPENIMQIEDDQLRLVGLSKSKALYLKNIAIDFIENQIFWQQLEQKQESELMEKLIKIKGVGRWTAEMFLIFHMAMPDILPLSDVGILKALNKLYGNDNMLTLLEIENLSKKWRPYRTVASWYLWRSLTPNIVAY